MKYIVATNQENQDKKYQQETEYCFEKWGKILVLEDEEARQLAEEDCWIEHDFEIGFNKLDLNIIHRETGSSRPVLFATIGEFIENPQISHYFEVREQKWEENKLSTKTSPWICCYTRQKWVSASDYLKCIDQLHHIADKLKVKLIILGNITSRLPYYKYRSLADLIVNSYLEKYKSLYIMQSKEDYLYKIPAKRKYEPYTNNIYYGIHLEKQLRSILRKENIIQEKKELRQTELLLYQDNFYERIPANQKIYVPLNLFISKDCTYYKNLGIDTVCIGKHYTFLYDERQKIDALTQTIRNEVLPAYLMPILSPAPIAKEDNDQLTEYRQINSALRYRGKDTYIGIIVTQGVDYRESFLKNSDGTTRIAYIWEQTEGNQGRYYTSEEVDRALEAESPDEIIPFEERETDETLVLGIAAGKNNVYEGLATEAEFIVAKINNAPSDLSRIYGGIPRDESVLMPDILVAINKMIELARSNNRPIVIYIPYNTNISPHDGSSIYEQILEEFGMEQGVSIIVPTGEEGDKSHHAVITPRDDNAEEASLLVRTKTEEVIGIIYMHSIQRQPFLLISPDSSTVPIRLDEKAVSQTGDSTIYSTGVQNDYQNGSRYILFCLDKMEPGQWKLLCDNPKSSSGYIELWLSQEALNPYVIIRPSTPFITLGSNAAVDNILSVAGFEVKDLVALGSSGRGYAWDGTIKPLCASQSKTPINYQNRWRELTGTAVSAGIMLGTVAMLYEKWRTELREEPYGNSLIMNNLVLSNLTQFLGETYPNRTQGYGVFEVDRIPDLLNMAID